MAFLNYFPILAVAWEYFLDSVFSGFLKKKILTFFFEFSSITQICARGFQKMFGPNHGIIHSSKGSIKDRVNNRMKLFYV